MNHKRITYSCDICNSVTFIDIIPKPITKTTIDISAEKYTISGTCCEHFIDNILNNQRGN